jgi:hypothetical protein
VRDVNDRLDLTEAQQLCAERLCVYRSNAPVSSGKSDRRRLFMPASTPFILFASRYGGFPTTYPTFPSEIGAEPAASERPGR